MSLKVNVRHLEDHDVHLEGQLAVSELDIDTKDEVIRLDQPLDYALDVQKLEGGLLAQGRLHVMLACECVRCLKPFDLPLELKAWTCHLPLEGDDRVEVVNDCVDLTPYLREDILLEIPQHPLCDPECRGLPRMRVGSPAPAERPGGPEAAGASVWAELNKLKF
ncbi:MAG: YceD family protein [Limisphaerales bacterium]